VLLAVSLYLGLPGDGKSLSGLRRVVRTLTEGSRYIVTNLPLEMGELQTYLRAKWGKDFDCTTRIVHLTRGQVRKFWLIRPHGWRLVDLGDDRWAQNEFPDLTQVFRWRPVTDGVEPVRQPLELLALPQVIALAEAGKVEVGHLGELNLGCDFIVDEAQQFWPARSFQTTPKGLLFYLSQHRHLGDDVIFITQKESQVEKVIRNLVMEFYVFKNLGQRSKLGFRLPKLFGYSLFGEPPSAQGAQYMDIGKFTLDRQLADCYRTESGVGVGGPVSADLGKRSARPSWIWAVGIAVVVLALVGWSPWGLARVFGWALRGKKPAATAAATNQQAVAAASVGPVARPPSGGVSGYQGASENAATAILRAISGSSPGRIFEIEGIGMIGEDEVRRVRSGVRGVVAVELADGRIARWGGGGSARTVEKVGSQVAEREREGAKPKKVIDRIGLFGDKSARR